MPEIPLKISRAIIRKKASELRHSNFKGQGESVLCNFAECAPMRTPRRRNLDVKDRGLEIEKGQAGLPRLNSYKYFITEIFEFLEADSLFYCVL